MDKIQERKKELIKLGFVSSPFGGYKKNDNFIITTKTINEFSSAEWSNLLKPFSNEE